MHVLPCMAFLASGSASYWFDSELAKTLELDVNREELLFFFFPKTQAKHSWGHLGPGKGLGPLTLISNDGPLVRFQALGSEKVVKIFRYVCVCVCLCVYEYARSLQ